MQDLKNSIHLSFFLISDGTYGKQKQELEKLFETYKFVFALDHEDPEGQHDRELIYTVNFDGAVDGESEELFSMLRVLFDEAVSYLPTFTQGAGDNS